MATNYPDVIPMIAYEDGPKAMDWLGSAFGFKERARMLDKDGRLSHGEMQAGDGVIMLATPTPDYQSPGHHRKACEPAQKWSAVPYIVDGVLVYVGDVDAHAAQAKRHGAIVLSDVEADQYGKRYRAEDLEGHRWMFMQRARAS
jgi:PhnB protein